MILVSKGSEGLYMATMQPTEERIEKPQGVPRFLAVDLESTGFNAAVDRIVQLCFIELDRDLRELGRWTTLIDPCIPIPPAMVGVHGIRDQDVAGKAPFRRWAGRIERLVGSATLIAYNAAFDSQLLHHELRRCGLPGIREGHPLIDPLKIYRAKVPDQYRLAGAVRHYLHRRHEKWHDAEADAEAAVEILRAQVAAGQADHQFHMIPVS